MFKFFNFIKYLIFPGVICLFLHPAITEASEDWTVKSSANDITIYSKKKNNGKCLSYKAEAVINAPINVIFHFFRDTQKSARFTPGVREKRILEEFSDKDRIEYAHIPLPWPFKDRYMVYRAQEVFDKGDEVLMTADSVENHSYKEKGRIRGSITNSEFLLKSSETDSGKTVVLATVNLDSGGWLPHWFIELYAGNWAGRLLKKLKAQAEEYIVQQENSENKSTVVSQL